MSDLAATNCNNGCGCEGGCSWILILILLFCCNGNNGIGGFGNGCGCGNDSCSIIWIILLLSCFCGNSF